MNVKRSRQNLARLQGVLNKFAERFSTDPDGDKEIIAEGFLAMQEFNVLLFAVRDGLSKVHRKLRVLEAKINEQCTAR